MNEQEMQALLDQLEPVLVPDVSMLPAPGWWVLATLCLLLVLLVWFTLRRRRALQWQRDAHRQLQKLRDQLETRPVAKTLSETSRLARQVLLVARNRQEVASLQGKPWLDALDELCGRPLFASGFGQLLEAGPYQRDPQVKPQDLDSLLDAVEELIGAAARHQQRSCA